MFYYENSLYALEWRIFSKAINTIFNDLLHNLSVYVYVNVHANCLIKWIKLIYIFGNDSNDTEI